MRRLGSLVVLLLGLGFALPALAIFEVPTFTVLGCEFSGNVGAFTTCITQSSANAVEDAVEDAEEALRESASMAQPGPEFQLLMAARQADLASLASCLQQAGVDLGSAISSMASNPRGTAANRLQVLVGERFAALQTQMNQLAAAGRSFNPAAPPSAGQVVDEAFDTLIAAAEGDPIARCGIPALQAQRAQIKQASVQAYDVLQSQINALVEQSVKPALLGASQSILAESLQSINARGSATSKKRYPPARQQRPSTKDLTKKRPQSTASKGGVVSKQRVATKSTRQQSQPRSAVAAKGSAITAQKQPRTRASGTFLSIEEAVQTGGQLAGQALEAGGAWIASQAPDDLKKIANAELAIFLLQNPDFTASTASIDNLATAVADGNAGTGSLAPLNALLDELDESNEDMYSRIALSSINFYGHETIDIAIDPLVSFVMGKIDGAFSVGDNVASIACSAASVASSLPCGGVKALVVFLADSLMFPAIEWVIVKLIRYNWDQATECAAVGIGFPASDDHRNCEIYRPVLQWFPQTATAATNFILPHIEESRTAFLNYHIAVRKLAAAVNAGGGS